MTYEKSAILIKNPSYIPHIMNDSNGGTHVFWWTQPNFVHLSPPHVLWWTQKAHVIWWTQIKIFPFQNLMSFDGPIGSIIRHEVYKGFQSFPLSKPHVFWWTHYLTKTSCLIMDPKPHVIWWTLDGFLGPPIDMRFLGPPKDLSAQKPHVKPVCNVLIKYLI